ncbi:helix-turn-helix transcriptional regulator [Lactobacillus sp. DCY120]|uniref:Helix-turn-helix transcriptional regulator n=1 Tax=Bombilactobacillus apium TaxID=2675299 RepID=A0A850R0H0_9LACO|nr:helix-turn-helix transcriptional regulator [Bombilactobacillus apium]NVY96423.1 helix-turn-helix transcriptional regulator [Bombilactobacillus apium]
MFQSQVIYETRRAKNLTQVELAAGICTQNTISKLENHNIAPTVNILTKICSRLELTLNDVFTEFSQDPQDDLELTLNDLEESYYNGELAEVKTKLRALNKVKAAKTNPRTFLLKAYLLLDQGELDNASFQVDLLLNQIQAQEDEDLALMLAYALKGYIYSQKQLLDPAEYYFNEIIKKVNAAQHETYSDLDIKRLLFLCKKCSGHYCKIDNKNKGLKIAQRGLQISQSHRSSLFVEDFYLTLAHFQPETKGQFLKTAQVFAEYNQDQMVVEKINAQLQ